MGRAVTAAVCGVAAAALIAVASSGCSGRAPVASTPSITKDELAKQVSAKVAAAATTPRSVTCRGDLIGAVGNTTVCTVDLGPATSTQVNVTVTAVNGTTVAYSTTPSQSQAQLDDAVRARLETNGATPVESVSCESGLDGTVGATAFCNVTSGSRTTREMVEVSAVDGAAMTFRIVPHLAKADVEESLQDRLRRGGQQPYAAACAGDLQGIPGATVSCDVFIGPRPTTFLLTVTTVDGGAIDYRFTPRD